MSTRRTPAQRLAELDRKRARLANQARTAATREKIILGAAVASEARASVGFADTLKAILLKRVTRESDKSVVAAFLENLPGNLPPEMPTQPVATAPEIESQPADPLAALSDLPTRRNRI